MARNSRRLLLGAMAIAALALGSVALAEDADFGRQTQGRLEAQSRLLFGVERPLASSSDEAVAAAEADEDPREIAKFAGGLRVRVVTTQSGRLTDQMALWPNDSEPTHLIACNEGGPTTPGLQRIEIATGETETIVSGTKSCDPIRRTPWGTIVFGEESGADGALYELIDPLHTTGVTLDRSAGTFGGGRGVDNLVRRDAVGRLSWEGIGLYQSGLMYYGDENGPKMGTGGGAYYKFVPDHAWSPSSGPITDLDQSPLRSGTVYGLRLGARGGSPTTPGADYGQGSQTGLGSWILAAEPNLRAEAARLELSGYYRPEDIDIDRQAEALGRVRFCGPNTGNEHGDNDGEVICLSDGSLAEAMQNGVQPELQYFVLGNPQLAMPDNIAYQPGQGNWIVHEDAETDYPGPGYDNNDLWACLPDGADADRLSDGCVRVATLNDPTAEWTGGIFDSSGKRFFVSVQHNITGHGIVFEVTGWR